jgi:hypothetical protein
MGVRVSGQAAAAISDQIFDLITLGELVPWDR